MKWRMLSLVTRVTTMLIFKGFSLSVNISIRIIIILLIIRFLLFRMPSFIIYALEISFGMRIIHSCRAIASTGKTSVSARRMIQRTLVSSLSMTVPNPNLFIPIGGQLRTVVDWWMASNAGTLSLGTWLPVADPDRADVPLYIEFMARHGHEFTVNHVFWLSRQIEKRPSEV
jgi:hypothetical protein